MKTALLLNLLALAGCSRVVISEPIGEEIPDADAALFAGMWQGIEGEPFEVQYDAESNEFTVSRTDAREFNGTKFSIRSLAEDVLVLWVEDKELTAYVPLRISISLAEDPKFITLLVPDSDEVEKRVSSGKIKGSYDEALRAWVISPEAISETLLSKDFWSLEIVPAFVKVDAMKQVHTASEQP
ncbi:MAG: hypothetical protein ACPGN3_08700 [Opitutales bacterium]